MRPLHFKCGMRVNSQLERVLWKRTSFPDNYVSPSFLSSLSRNANFRPYTYWHLVTASWSISQHLATIFVFLAVFVRLHERTLDPRLLVWISVIGFLSGYSVWEILDSCAVPRRSALTNRTKAVKSSILVFLALLSLSPVLRTLTAATSSDSIWALSACLLTLNVTLADYTTAIQSWERQRSLTSVLSVNAAISSSVVLASRLADDISVFALSLFSVLLFALFPILRRRLQSGPTAVSAILTASLLAMSLYLTRPLSSGITNLYATVFTLITFLAPAALVWAQRFKNQLKGSWDPAIPKVNTAAAR